MERYHTPLIMLTAVACLALYTTGTVAVAREVRLDLAAFAGQSENGSGNVKLPFAWGLHRAKDEWAGWNTLWLRMKGSAGSNVHAVYNRVFCPIGPERANQATAIVPDKKTFAMTGDWSWFSMPVAGNRLEYRFELTTENAGIEIDKAILTDNDDFKPASLDAKALSDLPVRKPRTEPADRLFEMNPLMPLRDYALEVAKLSGVTPGEPTAVVNEDGAPLLNGKPWFPMMIYHAWPGDHDLDDVPLNVMSDAPTSGDIPCPKLCQRYFLGQERCYQQLFEYANGERNASSIAIIYLADEPDLQMDVVCQRRMHELVKAVMPGKLTLYVDCLHANPPEAFRTSDMAGYDFYPIGRKEDWLSIQCIEWEVDRMRWASGNAPCIFVVQTFDWQRFLPYEAGKNCPGGFPTDRELACMTWLPVARGVRGLYFFNYRDIHGEKRQTIVEYAPKGWAQFKRLVGLLDTMKKALAGPEVHLPWKAEGEARFRIAVSPERDQAFLIAVNPMLHTVKATCQLKGTPLENASFEKLFADGVTADLSVGTFTFEELGSAVYRINGGDLSTLRRKSTAEVLKELEPQASSPAGPGPYLLEAQRLGRTGQSRE